MRGTLCSLALLAIIACGPGSRRNPGGDDDDGPGCPSCTEDNTGVVDCDGNVTQCLGGMSCSKGACMNSCEAAEANHESVGCDYYAVDMDAAQGPPFDACFAVFVANTSREQVHMDVDWGGIPIDLARYAKLPSGEGRNLQYQPYNPATGLAAGEVAILFLAYAPAFMNVACPVPAAVGTDAQISGTGKGKAFHIKTDNPVVAYQMLPYGGGKAAATGASLLLPSSAWGDNYVAVSAYDAEGGAPPIPVAQGPSFNIVAKEDGTTVTMRPKSSITGGGGMPAGAANQPYTFTLDKGEYAQITQLNPLTGSPISADKPVGVFGGHQIMSIDRCCGDHGEQMLAPVRALGFEYAAAPHADRKPVSEERVYRIVGAVDDTQLTYDPPGVGPTSLALGQVHEIRTATPFTVRSQDEDHPFQMFTYMTGAGEQGEGGWGDADFVRLVPPAQFLKRYVFFTDPTYPFTTLTVVRGKDEGSFYDVYLDCMGGTAVSGWQPIGNGDFEIAYVKLVDHWNGMSGCNNGVNRIESNAAFGVWVWGWGSEDTNTAWVSYGYPAGEGVLPINDVVIY
jgi:hypothetical protein